MPREEKGRKKVNLTQGGNRLRKEIQGESSKEGTATLELT
jgi:hypothetical protein